MVCVFFDGVVGRITLTTQDEASILKPLLKVRHSRERKNFGEARK
jgi:hypothetical protein